MNRYIDADALHEMINWTAWKPPFSKKQVRRFIDNTPTADVRENVRGEWINKGFMVAECSNCKEQFHELEIANFCPNCGADMRGEKDET